MKGKISAAAIVMSVFCIVILSGCSVVFTGSITGSLVDQEMYDNGDAVYGIADAEIYLYTELETRDADYDSWVSDNSILPDNPAEELEPAYFLKTITDEQGNYSFNGFIWNELFPDYGKSGDRKEIFMLFYHSEYGLVKTPYPVYVVSDVTNRIPLFKLIKILNTAEISGSVSSSDNDEALANVNVGIWVPESWSYDASGNVMSPVWSENPSYTAITDGSGEWSQNISYRMMPDSISNRGTVIVRIAYSANGYLAENVSDPEIIDGGWDKDGNGVIDEDESDGYYESGLISAGSYVNLGDIALSDAYNSAVVSGRVINSSTGGGEPGINVRIFVAEDWSYNSSDPADIESEDSVDWPQNPQYRLNTDSEGNFSSAIRFERRPSESDNRGTTRVRIVFIKNSFLIDSTTDARLTDNPAPGGPWDIDGNGTVDADEDDSYLDPDVITADMDNNIGSITVKQTEFSETLNGEVWNRVPDPDVLVNGVEVWLFYAPDSATLETPTPSASDAPTRITSTTAVTNLVTGDLEAGRFSFSGLEWEDAAYSGNQSKASYYIHLPSAAERADGGLAAGLDPVNDKYYLTSGASNYISLDL